MRSELPRRQAAFGGSVGDIANIQIGVPETTRSAAATSSERDHWYFRGAYALADLYGELLGWVTVEPGYVMLIPPDGRRPHIGFESSPGNAPPRWPDPNFPQQMHLDIEVGDLDGASRAAEARGAVLLADYPDHRVYEDNAGHPFCLCRVDAQDAELPGRLARIVIDCFSPRALARFYEELFDYRTRVIDTSELVVLARDPMAPMLALQHAVFAPARWPDPAYPTQFHFDVVFGEDEVPEDRLERAGAVRLRHERDHLIYADPAGHPCCVGVEAASPPLRPSEVMANYIRWARANLDRLDAGDRASLDRLTREWGDPGSA